MKSFLSPTERILVLKTVPGFRELELHSLRHIVQLLDERWFSAGELLMQEDEPIEACYFVAQGACDISVGGKQFCVKAAPHSIGIWSILSGERRGTATARAQRDLVAMSVDPRSLLRLLESNFDALNQTLRFAARCVLEHRDGLPFAPDRPPTPATREPQSMPLDLVDKLEFLSENAWFQGANLDAVAEICRAQREVRHPAGTVLWRTGDTAETSYGIVAGKVAVMRDGRTLATLGADYTFGLFDGLGVGQRTYTAVAESDVVLLETDIPTLLEIEFDHFDLARRLYATLRKAAPEPEFVC